MASRLTKAARGQDCTIQIHPYCNMNTETVVFCHAPSEDKGMGIKSADWWGAFGCSDCHDIVDGRRRTDIDPNELFRCFMRGVHRTLKIQIESGNL